MQAVILAGGLGKRLRPLTNAIPKPLVTVNGRPFLELKLEQLRSNGVNDIVLCVGYLGGMIENHFGNGSSFDVAIRYSYDGNELLGPIGALKKAEPLLGEEFFVTYGDNYLLLSYAEMLASLRSSKKMGVLAVLHNKGAYGKSDTDLRGGHVISFEKNPSRELEWINYGIYALKKKSLLLVPRRRHCEEEEFFGRLISKKQLLAYEVRERFYEIGTQQSLAEFEDFIREHAQPYEGVNLGNPHRDSLNALRPSSGHARGSVSSPFRPVP